MKNKTILIQCKSIPRSGLHLLKSYFQSYLQEKFSFCEYYNEPGCCKKSPCALSCFLKNARESNEIHLRLIKSHDFNLTDHFFATSSNKRILILKRDPLYTITSWWELIEINRHASILKNKHIDPLKIFYLHEKAVFNSALSIIDSNYKAPSDDFFYAWLDKQLNYMKKFNEKWINDPKKNDFVEIVDYSNIPEYALSVSRELANINPKQNMINSQINFKSRIDPFTVKSKKVSEFIESKRKIIKSAISQIL